MVAVIETPVEAAVGVIKSGDRVFVHGANAYPQALIRALTARAPELRNVEVVSLHTNGDASYTDPEYAGHFHHRALFVGPNVREAVDSGRATYVPIFLSDIPKLFRSGHMPLDVALLHVSPPDEHGFCSLGTSVDCTLAAARAAKTRIAQINPNMPRTHGDSFIHIRELDYTVDVDDPLPEFESGAPNATQVAIGQNVADLTPNGATLQLGIGGIPNAVLAALSGHKDVGIHSEVVSDGIVDLVESGVINGSKKTLNNGKIVVSFLNGTRRLYDFVDDNPMVEMRQVDYTNSTLVILRLDNMIAINSAIEIDLTGQVCAESMGSKVYSGVGGQMDFMRGASLSQGGKPIIALAATAKNDSISRIVPQLRQGAGVTTTRAHMHYVVTEYGQVDLHGLDLEERAKAMISLAHPIFREELERSARDMCLLRSC
jgi:4-hydroxybutyrate CoA-transferase